MPAKAGTQAGITAWRTRVPAFRGNDTLRSVNVASNNHFKTVTHHFVQPSESTPPFGARRRR